MDVEITENCDERHVWGWLWSAWTQKKEMAFWLRVAAKEQKECETVSFIRKTPNCLFGLDCRMNKKKLFKKTVCKGMLGSGESYVLVLRLRILVFLLIILEKHWRFAPGKYHNQKPRWIRKWRLESGKGVGWFG